MELSYCVINTNGRDLLLNCLASIRRTNPRAVEHEIVVLDNASTDGSAEAIRGRFPEARVITRERRAGITANLDLLLREARGRLFLFLNEDCELTDGAVAALLGALEADPRAGAAGAMLLDANRRPTSCAYRLPGLGAALAGALFLHRWLVDESGGEATHGVGWARSAALLIRREAADEVGYFDTDYFFYGEDVDFQKRLHDAGWRILHVPAARVVHFEEAEDRRTASARRVVEFHRSRDIYMRKHHSAPVRMLVRVLTAWSYLPRALASIVLPGHDPRWYWLHARRALLPWRGEGMSEATEAYNRRLTSEQALAARAAR
jgi:N-acetylglucosaminyl-diphospho-decaprenol L-rhamnosyltransferase